MCQPRPSPFQRLRWLVPCALALLTLAVAPPPLVGQEQDEAAKRESVQGVPDEMESAREAQRAAKRRLAKAKSARETARANLAEAVAAEERARRVLAERDANLERAERELAEARLAEATAMRQAAEAAAERERLESEVAELELRDALSRLDRAEERLAEERRLVDLFRRANQLRSDEVALAAKMERALPLPASAFDLGPSDLDQERVEELLAERDRLRAERGALRATLPEEAPIGAEPYALLLAEANFALHYARGPRNLGRAEELFQEAAAARPDLPEPILGLGLAALRSGRPGSSTELLRDAVERTRALRGEEHPDYARALSALREASLALTDDDPNFIRQYKRSLDVLEPQWAEMSILLARNWTDAGEAQRGLLYSLPAIEFAEETRGAGHPSVADAHEAAADGLKALGQWDAASEHVLKALSIRSESLGPNHPLTAETLCDAGSLSRLVGKPEQAEAFFRKALAVREAALGAGHPLVAATRNNVALAMMDQGRYDDAEPLLREAAAALAEACGEKHPMRASALCNLAACVAEQGKAAEAARLYREAHLVRSESLGANHPLTLHAAAELERIENLSTRLADARRHYNAHDWADAAKAFADVAAFARSAASDAPPPPMSRMNALYNAACSAALGGDAEGSFLYLDQAIEAGFSNVEHMQTDPDLESIRADRLRFSKATRKAGGAGEE